mgnify:FL=1
MRSFRVKTAKQPLKAYLDNNIFKIYALDVGLLGAMAGIAPKLMIQGHRIFREYEGSLVENYVAQQLKAEKGLDLFYWQSSGTAEVDFVCEYMDHVLPLEAKAGINPKSKSLRSFGKRFSPLVLTRTTLLNLKRQDELVNLPLYAVSLFPELIAGMRRQH